MACEAKGRHGLTAFVASALAPAGQGKPSTVPGAPAGRSFAAVGQENDKFNRPGLEFVS
jgi:hypothetical protein